MREKITESRSAHALAEARIFQLNKDVDDLTDKILALKPKEVVKVEIDRENSSALCSESHCTEPARRKNTAIPLLYYWTSMAGDALCEVLHYVSLDSIVHLEMTCKSMRRCIAENIFWYRVFPIFFPLELPCAFQSYILRQSSALIPSVSSGNDYQRSIREYLNNIAMSIKFVRMMKEQRSIPKHRSIQPHHHNRNEITHPLPLFASQQMIMSRAETLNSDFRSYAHNALLRMFDLTTNTDDLINAKLAHEGAVTVLISLLANEEGALQNYSCGVLANLLCWEARRERLSSQSDTPVDALDGSVTPSYRLRREQWLCSYVPIFRELFPESIRGDHESYSYPRPNHGNGLVRLCDQIQACNGVKQLAGLLTSPSASINLAGGQARSSGGFRELRMIASVQGISTKHASRSLINLFYPRMCVPAPPFQSQAGPRPPPPRSSPPLGEGLPQIVNKNLVATPSIGGLFLSGERPTPWQFTYFYKSGSFKDQFTAYLKFLPDGYCKGRGVDQFGPFLFSGKVDPDITGWAWYFHKSYLRMVDLVEVDLSSWVGMEDEEGNAGGGRGGGGVSKAPIHVSHIGYWSEGVDLTARQRCDDRNSRLLDQLYPSLSTESRTVNDTDSIFPSSITRRSFLEGEVEDQVPKELSDEQSMGVWGIGLWGVWETATTTPHFELQKGGVFRAAPIVDC